MIVNSLEAAVVGGIIRVSGQVTQQILNFERPPIRRFALAVFLDGREISRVSLATDTYEVELLVSKGAHQIYSIVSGLFRQWPSNVVNVSVS